MSRKLAYLLNTVEVHRDLKDCKTTRTITLKLTSDLMKRLTGRYIIEKGEVVLFDRKNYKEGDVIQLRSPIYCIAPKICHTCYGKLLERHRTPYVGILASQVIGERGTQLSMKAFHMGGAVSLKQRDMLTDILNNDPLSGLTK